MLCLLVGGVVVLKIKGAEKGGKPMILEFTIRLWFFRIKIVLGITAKN